eukprot:gene10890-7747_t
METQPLKTGSSSASNVKYQALEVAGDEEVDRRAASGQQCTVFETSCNLAKVITGSGMLSLPFAIASAGWLSLGALVALGLIFSYAFDLLVAAIEAFKATDAYEPGTVVNYVTLGKHCFGRHGDKLVLSIFATELVLALMSFFMNIAINAEVLSPLVSYEAAVCVACAINIFFCSFELKLTAYASAIGYFMIGFVLVALLWCGEEMEAADQAALQRRYVFFHASGLPLAAGLVAFCFGGHSTFPKLYAAMEQPARYREVIWAAMAGVIVLYVSFAAVGYAAYAQFTEAPVTLNIGKDTLGRVFPDGHFLRFTAAVGVVCNLLVTCPLVTLPVTDTLNLLCQRRPDADADADGDAVAETATTARKADERSGAAARAAVVTTSRRRAASSAPWPRSPTRCCCPCASTAASCGGRTAPR